MSDVGQIGAVWNAAAISIGGGDQTVDPPCRGVYISGAGTLVVRLQQGTADTTFTGLLAGTIYPLRVKAIRNSGTNAAGLILY